MQKLSGWQLFALVILCLLLLAGVAYLDHAYIALLVAAILSVFGVGLHLNGVNTALPLSTATALPATLEVSTSAAQEPASAPAPEPSIDDGAAAA